MRKRQAAVAAVAAIILGVTVCSGNTRTAATTAPATAAQETTVSGETTAATPSRLPRRTSESAQWLPSVCLIRAVSAETA